MAGVHVLDNDVFVVLEVVTVGMAIVVDDDMVVTTGGEGCKARGWGFGWGDLGRLGGLLVRCRRFLGRQGHSIGGTTCFGKHVFSSLRNVVVWAADGPCTLLMA